MFRFFKLPVWINRLPSLYIQVLSFFPNMPAAPVLSTIKNLSAPRQRIAPTQKAPPIPSHQRKEKLEKRQENQRRIDEAVAEWYTYTLAKAEDLGKQFNKKPRYFLDIFFQGGAKMVTHNSKTNSFNAFKSLKAIELNEGHFFSLIEDSPKLTNIHLQTETLPDYKNFRRSIMKNMKVSRKKKRMNSLQNLMPTRRHRQNFVDRLLVHVSKMSQMFRVICKCW